MKNKRNWEEIIEKGFGLNERDYSKFIEELNLDEKERWRFVKEQGKFIKKLKKEKNEKKKEITKKDAVIAKLKAKIDRLDKKLFD